MGARRARRDTIFSIGRSRYSITATQSAATLGVLPPDHRTPCANVFTGLDSVDGDDTGDINPFWSDRDYGKDVSKVKAASTTNADDRISAGHSNT